MVAPSNTEPSWSDLAESTPAPTGTMTVYFWPSVRPPIGVFPCAW